MKADEFDEKFDRGEDVTGALDTAKAHRPGEEQRRVNVDFPVWMIAALDREARRLGVTRQSVIKVWLAERLEHRTTPPRDPPLGLPSRSTLATIERMGTETELLAAGTEPERVATGAIWAEGPVWLPDRKVVLFSDVIGNKVFRYDPATGELGVHRDDVEYLNGRTLDRDGAIVACSHGRRAVQREVDGEVGVLTERWAGGRYNSPNDVVVRRDGTIWFTDPAYGIKKEGEGHPGTREYGDHFVFRLDPADGSVRVVVSDVEAPNGLAFSPDESLLYVADSGALNSDGSARPSDRPGTGTTIRVYDVRDGRRAKNGRTFVTVAPGIPDGIRVDERGNVWSSSGDGVHVFSPAGEHLVHVPVPEVVANLCFGGEDGRTVYMAGTTSLYRIEAVVRDAAHLPSP